MHSDSRPEGGEPPARDPAGSPPAGDRDPVESIPPIPSTAGERYPVESIPPHRQAAGDRHPIESIPPVSESPAAWPPYGAEPPLDPAMLARRRAADRGLLFWLIVLGIFGVGGVLLGQQELALLVALSGLFVAAQAADLEPRWEGLYRALTWVAPSLSAGLFAMLAIMIAQGELTTAAKVPLVAFTLASAVFCFATGFRPVANGLSRVLLRADPPSHILRLATRLIVAGLLLPVPGWFALRDVLTDQDDMLDQLPLGGGLIGYVLMALAAVGFQVRRDLRETLDRLGIKPLTAGHAGVVVLGVVGLLLLNHGADLLQQRVFPGLWRSDQAFNEALAGGLSTAQAVLLGMSAGIGEEVTMRGALQPRLGLGLTSLLFASLHVQYSWYGMAVIFVLGVALGWIRNRTSTTVAISIHVLYDIVAVLTT